MEYLLYVFLKKKKFCFKIGHYCSYSVAWTKKLSTLNKFYNDIDGEKERNEDQIYMTIYYVFIEPRLQLHGPSSQTALVITLISQSMIINK